MDVSIIIVNYNTKSLTLDCISSIVLSEFAGTYEIILVDNASTDGTVGEVELRYPQVHIIENGKNEGFSKANNRGILRSSGRYVLLLNSDTVVEAATLRTMLDYMDGNLHVGASGCKLILPDGTLDDACKRGFPTPRSSFYYAFGISRVFRNRPRFHRYKLIHLDADQVHEVDSLVGAFMMVRREAIDQVGLLDESFFMYGEDIDWCYRMKHAGWKVIYYPGTTVIHYKGASSRRKPFKVVYEFHRAMILFHRKHYARKYHTIVNVLVYAGVALKFGLAFAGTLIKYRR